MIINNNLSSVVNIAYLPNFREAMDFFRAVIASNEHSQRVLSLTKRVIMLNAANYTAWHFRRTCLFELNQDLNEELSFLEDFAENNPKNYQVWYHRRALVEHLNDGTQEPQFVSQILNNTDTKNYQAWAHRQWAIKRFNIWEGELEFCDYLLREDVRNNSAWNHRWFVVTRGGSMDQLDSNTAIQEFTYLQEKAELAPSNECPYSYLRAISTISPTLKLGDDVVFTWLTELLDNSASSSLVNLRSLLVDSLLERNQNDQAVELCIQLANRYDPIRAAYWRWRAASIT